MQPSSKRQLWFAAIKPPMYTVAVIPVILGTAIAYGEIHQFSLIIFLTFLLSAIFIIAWMNISNDVFDAETGIDQNKYHSIVNLTGNKTLMFWVGNLFLIMGLLGISLISWWVENLLIIGLIFPACFLAYTYQGPPFRLGYYGLGEVICLITFPMVVIASIYAQGGIFSLTGLAASFIIGISTAIILFCSHFHQVKDDLQAGKLSPIVRLGTQRGYQVLKWMTITVFVLPIFLVIGGYFPIWTLLIFVSFPFAYKLINHVQQYHSIPEKVSNSKFIAVNFHFISGIFLSLGFILTR
jgi:2-carboxy-1,4-naphthoquinone phytyltransferase